MVGDGNPGEIGGSDEANGPESEPPAPSSRGERALLAAGIGERSDSLHDSVQSNGNAARAALERDVHRFQAVTRQDRVRKKQSRARARVKSDVSDNQESQHKQLTAAGDRTAGVSKPNGRSSTDRDSGGPERIWTAQVSGDADAGDERWLKAAPSDSELASTEAHVGMPPTDADEEATARAGRETRRRRRKQPANDVPTRLLLAIIAAEWDKRIAAFGYPGRVAPPKPECPTDYAEAFALTADERRALPKDKIRHLNVKASKLVVRALRAARVIEQWREAIAQLPVDMRLIDNFATYARAFGHSDTLVSTSFEVVLPDFAQDGETMVLTPQQRLQRLLELTRAARARLKLEVNALMDLGAIPAGALKNLKGRSGHSNTGTDVLALLELLRNAATRGVHVRITERDLGRYSVLAQTLIVATARQSNKRGGEARALALEERARALTLLWLSFWEARNALAHIFGQRLNVNVVLPTLVENAGGGRRR